LKQNDFGVFFIFFLFVHIALIITISYTFLLYLKMKK